MAKKKQNPQELIDPNGTAFALISPDNAGKYDIADKWLAISFLDALQRPMNGDLVPRFTHVAELLNTPESTLRGWWDNKDLISKQADSCVTSMNKAISSKMTFESLRIIRSLFKVDWDKVGVKQRLEALKTLIPNARLLEGKSTGKFEHEHQHFFSPIPPKK